MAYHETGLKRKQQKATSSEISSQSCVGELLTERGQAMDN